MARQARALRTYDRVLDAAANEFAQNGYARTNLQNVADRTGLTKGAVYGHFSSKEELAAVIVAHLDSVTDDLLGSVRESTVPAFDRLRRLILSLAELFERDMRVRAALRLALETAQADAKPPQILDEVQGRTRALVDEMRNEGCLDPSLPAGAVADLVTAAVFGTHYTATACGQENLSGRVRAMWEVLTRTVITSGSR